VDGFVRGGILALLQVNWGAFCASSANAGLFNVGRLGDRPDDAHSDIWQTKSGPFLFRVPRGIGSGKAKDVY